MASALQGWEKFRFGMVLSGTEGSHEQWTEVDIYGEEEIADDPGKAGIVALRSNSKGWYVSSHTIGGVNRPTLVPRINSHHEQWEEVLNDDNTVSYKTNDDDGKYLKFGKESMLLEFAYEIGEWEKAKEG